MRFPFHVAPLLLLVLFSAHCAKDDPVIEPVRPIITDVSSSQPMVEGTTLRVRVANLDALGPRPFLDIDANGTTYSLALDSADGGLARFLVGRSLVRALGAGAHDTMLRVGNDEVSSEGFPYRMEVTETLPVALDEGLSGTYHRNELAIVAGAGFLEENEGTIVAAFTGTFRDDDGASSDVNAEVPVLQAEVGDRLRGAIQLTTALGGIRPGRLTGTMTLRSELATGERSESGSQDVDIVFQDPIFFSLAPSEAGLESVVTVRGAGFLGGSGTDEVTLMRVAGTFTPEGGAGRSFDEDLVLAWMSGSDLHWSLGASVVDDILTSDDFGAPRGVLNATFTPITIKGRDEYEGVGGPATLTLGAPRQVVWLRLLPGFYESLPRFGLAAAASVIDEMIAERIQSIYGDWNVDVRTERPTDVTPAGITTIEIGGPDPNGIGLFGYDNSPGKDVGNLRLFDTIGGANAETQEDGYPGYGGVFIDGFLFFSENDRPTSGTGPDPDPLFDEIFGGVRSQPATLEEVRGGGARGSEVQRAVTALASMIGETTAHELGHSFGLASPYGSATTFHNRSDRPGCLMDAGSARPFGERTAQAGWEATHLCGDNAEYMDEILGD